MFCRVLLTAVVAVTCFATAPAGPPIPSAPADPGATDAALPTGRLPTDREFVGLLKTDPIRAFEVVLQRYRRDVHGYTCVMRKQERVRGTLGPVEVVDVAFRDDPFSVFLAWQGSVGLGKPVRTLYVRGENQGLTLVKTRFLVLSLSPDGREARDAARYSIEDFGFYNTTLRTLRAWKAARARGRLVYEYLGERAPPESGGRVCHALRRICDPPEVDTFSLADKDPVDPAARPQDAFTTVTVLFDAGTWLQVGSEQKDAAGQLVGSYYFADVNLNPRFPPDQFTPAAVRK